MTVSDVARIVKPNGLRMTRVFTTEGIHPYDTVEWERTDIEMRNWRDNEVNFAQSGVEFPVSWSANARQIVASKYFRGRMGDPHREYSLKQILNRVVDTYTDHGTRFGYFDTPEDAGIFNHELKYMLMHQYFSFNSPVWFNIGCPDVPQQVSACFLLSVEDTLPSILNWVVEEGMIFKGGSGAGVNLSRIRSSAETLSSGGKASGPVSFMRGADASAGTIKSGGSTRRAAKLVCLDVDHPDIEDFITVKAREERKIRVLAEAGFDVDLDGVDWYTVAYQNANNSVHLTDEFMEAVQQDALFPLKSRTTGETVKEVRARELFRSIAQAAWECADPGVQYSDTINSWHTCPRSGRITTSNPCGEYVHLDNSSCNLASMNLLKFMVPNEDNPMGTFDKELFRDAVKMVITAMDISVSFADFPTEKITETSRAFRQLGIGYCNLGALLMSMGLPYDSEDGRAVAAGITSLMSAASYSRSAELAELIGPYDGYVLNKSEHYDVIKRHLDASVNHYHQSMIDASIFQIADGEWNDAITIGAEYGWRNAQVSLIAPTGTISFMMDADTTGIEPDFALKKNKKLVGGGSIKIANQSVPRALQSLGYEDIEQAEIIEYIMENGHVIDAPHLKAKHYSVFDCAVGTQYIAPYGHVRMMAAVQPFLSGAISKTVNLPSTATVEDIEQIHMDGWLMGLKSVAVYRDETKSGQPLSSGEKKAEIKLEAPPFPGPVRHRLPSRRPSETISFTVGGAEGYLTSGSYPDNGIGEIFLKLGKQGSTLAGLLDAFSIAVSIALQYGVPLDVFVQKFTGMQFEPRGMTNDSDIRIANSVLDYVFRRLALDYLSPEARAQLGVYSVEERQVTEEIVIPVQQGFVPDSPLCVTCGTPMIRAGVCFVCESCGSTSGCS